MSLPTAEEEAEEEQRMSSSVAESEPNYSGISYLLKRANMKERSSESITKRATEKSLKMAPKNIGKRGLVKSHVDEDSIQRDAAAKAQSKLEAQREYSRKSAARCRKRQKERVAAFEEKCKEVSDETKEYQRTNDILQAQVAMLVDQNLLLLAERHQDLPAPAPFALFTPSLSTAQIPPAALEGLSLDQLLQMLQR
jgi:hypothetical protein